MIALETLNTALANLAVGFCAITAIVVAIMAIGAFFNNGRSY
jgi:hypothetical protein